MTICLVSEFDKDEDEDEDGDDGDEDEVANIEDLICVGDVNLNEGSFDEWRQRFVFAHDLEAAMTAAASDATDATSEDECRIKKYGYSFKPLWRTQW